MNRALWYKSWLEARVLLVCCAGLMFGFHWMFVWVTSQVQVKAVGQFLKALPDFFQNLPGIPIEDVASIPGRLAMAYVDPIVLIITAVWGISRGSDVVSGELNRGTMEMLVAQPVRRFSILWSHATITIAGAALIALMAYLGTCTGLALVTLEEEVASRYYIPAAINVFTLMVFLAGVSTLASSVDRYRWRTIGFMGGFYVFGLLLEILGRMVTKLAWIRYFTFLAAFEPQDLVRNLVYDLPDATSRSLELNGVLLGLGIASYVAATIIFCHRDLPAPL